MPIPKRVKPIGSHRTRPLTFEITHETLIVNNNGNRLFVSLNCPSLRIGDGLYGNAVMRQAIQGDIASGKPVEVVFEPFPLDDRGRLEVRLFIQWIPGEDVFRKWAIIKLDNGTSSKVLNEVILECLDLTDDFRPGIQS